MVAGRLSLNQTAIRFEDDCVKFYICSEILEDFKGPFKFFLNRKRHHIKEHAIITDMLYPLTIESEISHIEDLGYSITPKNLKDSKELRKIINIAVEDKEYNIKELLKMVYETKRFWREDDDY